MVEAKAGSGKTSTIIRCYLQGGRNGKSIFLAFNKASGPGTLCHISQVLSIFGGDDGDELSNLLKVGHVF